MTFICLAAADVDKIIKPIQDALVGLGYTGLWDFALVTAALTTVSTGEGSVLPFAALLAVLPICLYGVFLLRGS